MFFVIAMLLAAPPPDGQAAGASYGSQILVVDAVAAAVAVGGVGLYAAGSHGLGTTLGFLGVVGLQLGAPIVHFRHGKVGTGFGSLGMRLAFELVGGAIGAGLGSAIGNKSSSCGDVPCIDSGAWAGALVGASVGLIGAIVVDATVLAHEDPPPRVSAVILPAGGLALRGRF